MMGSRLASASELHPDISVCVFTVFAAPCKAIRSRSADGSETLSAEDRRASGKCPLHVPLVINAVDTNLVLLLNLNSFSYEALQTAEQDKLLSII